MASTAQECWRGQISSPATAATNARSTAREMKRLLELDSRGALFEGWAQDV
jgi:hypothetical protein